MYSFSHKRLKAMRFERGNSRVSCRKIVMGVQSYEHYTSMFYWYASHQEGVYWSKVETSNPSRPVDYPYIWSYLMAMDGAL